MKKLVLLISFAVLAAFAAMVWPTRYRYDHTEHPRSRTTVLVRIDRLSGQAEYLTSVGWRKYMPYRAP